MRDAKDGITSLAVTDHEIVTGSVDCKVRRYDIRANRLFSDFIGGINALKMYVYSINLFVCSQHLLVSHSFSHTNTHIGNQMLIVYPVACSVLQLVKSVKCLTTS
jgi:hypothetical protein